MALQYDWEAIDVMEVLLNQSHRKIQVTESVAEFAARKLPRSQEMQSVLEMRTPGSRTTEALLTAAAENHECGKAMVKLLLHRGKGQVKITEDVLIGVAKNTSRGGEEILEWMLQEHADQVKVTEQVLLEAAWNPFQGSKIMVLLLNQEDVEIVITEAVVNAAAMSWLESEEMLKVLDQQEVDFQILSTILIGQGPRGTTGYFQQISCQEMNKTSLQTTKLLLNKLDPEYKTREEILLSSVGDMAVRLMLQLLDEQPIVFQDDDSFHVNIKLMNERGFTSKGLAFCSSHSVLWITILKIYHRIMQQAEAISFPYKTLILAASNEKEGHLIIPQILGGNDSWLQDKQLVSTMITTAAASGQVELLHYFFERCNIEESKRGDLLVISSLFNAVKLNDEGKVTQLLVDGTEPDTSNARGHTPLWQACICGHTSMVRHLLGTGAVEIERTDRWERTILHWAAALNHHDITKLLLSHGSDPDRKDRMKLTPLKLAQRWRAKETKNLLQNLDRGEKLDEIFGEKGEHKQ